ncbi:uncharacterized protein LOC114258981 [Camellia sinensis]|uniref:uncharacterized protein LOC114258981 n=1 Tax=Camellia sinensis TaxID=4442 RepID=UPI0010366245|nr:uncharacterized protein LOC114258981 [Camellia sinensis]
MTAKNYILSYYFKSGTFPSEDDLVLKEDETNRQVVAAVDAWKHADFLCRNYILNGLDNTLYNIYSPIKMAKELWESLERKNKTEYASSKKFLVGKFLDFVMVDSKTVISQVQDLQLILCDIHAEGMPLSESSQVTTLIEILPQELKKCKNYLKHKYKEMTLEELIVRLRMEEDNRISKKRVGKHPMESKGHRAKDCRSKSKGKRSSSKKPAQANVTEVDQISNGVDDINLSAVVFEVNLIGNLKEWLVDTGATHYICADKKMLFSYSVVDNKEQLFMGNFSISKVEG